MASFLRTSLTVVWWGGIAMTAAFSIFMIYCIINGLPHGLKPPVFSLDADMVRIEFPDAVVKNPKLLFMAMFPFGLIMFGLGLTILYQLRKIFATLAAGNPFLLENAKRIRAIGLLIFSGVIVELVCGNVLGKLFMDNISVKGVEFSVKGGINLGGIFIGLVMLILAEIFRQGALLREEQDLTV